MSHDPRPGHGPRPRPTPAQQVGLHGEDVAAEHLARTGHRVLDRRWRCPLGEIDIVAVHGDGPRAVVVVCEVKTRRTLALGDPLEAVTAAKVRRLRRLAAAWCVAHPQVAHREVRLDAIGVLLRTPGAAPEVRHVRGIVP